MIWKIPRTECGWHDRLHDTHRVSIQSSRLRESVCVYQIRWSQLVCVSEYNEVTPSSFAFWSCNLLKKILFKGLKRLICQLIQVLWRWIRYPAKKGFITLSYGNSFLSLDHYWIVHALIFGLAYFCCGSVDSYYVPSFLQDNVFYTICRPSILFFGLHAFIHSQYPMLIAFCLLILVFVELVSGWGVSFGLNTAKMMTSIKCVRWFAITDLNPLRYNLF